jgi:hypothetical protein
MGGGESLPAQLSRCPGRDSAVYLSANEHGAKLVGCDYIVALDKIADKIRPFGIPIVTRHLYGDYRILKAPMPDSGNAAAWIARLLGCRPIYIAGVDLFGGYWHDAAAQSNRNVLPLEDHLRRWRFLFAKYPADYRPLGGPLVQHAIAGVVDARIPSRDELESEIAGVVIEFTSALPSMLRGRSFEKGELAELLPGEAKHFTSNNRARLCRQPRQSAV